MNRKSKWLICVLLALAVCSYGFIFVRTGPPAAGATGACGGSSPSADGDIICEDSEGSNNPINNSSILASWTTNIESGDTLTTGSHTNSWPCSSSELGSKTIQIAVVDDDEDTNAIHSFTPQGEVNLQLYFWANLVSFEAGEFLNIFALTTAAGVTGDYARLQIYNDAGTLKFIFPWEHTGGTGSKTCSTAFSNDQIYKIELHYTKDTTDDVYIYIDDTLCQASAGKTSYDTNIEKIILGSYEQGSNFNAGDSATMEIDIIELDDDTIPGDCVAP